MKKQINQYVGRKIKEIREGTLKITQEELAGSIGVSRPSIVNIENGRQQLNVTQLMIFAAALGVGPCDLLPQDEIDDSSNLLSHQLPSGTPQAYRDWLDNSTPAKL